MDERVKKIMLIVTEDCNLACSYCYEHEKTNKVMDFKTAKTIIDSEFNDSTKYDKGCIEFFGGEAFLNFNLIKQVYNYVVQNYKVKPMVFYNTTNGTLIHGEIQSWLKERSHNFICSLSLDGDKYAHNLNRYYPNGIGSFDDIDIDFFTKTWPDLYIKLTTSQESLPALANSVKYIESLGVNCIATFATGIEWNNKDNNKIIMEQLIELLDYYEINNSQKLCKLFDYNLSAIFEPIDENFRYCGAGVTMKCYDTDGNWYPCQGFAPVSIGESSLLYKQRNFIDFRLSDNNPCKQCKFLKLCTTCFAANYNTTGNLEKQCKEICYFNRCCILASSTIQYHRIVNSSDSKEMDIEQQLTLKAIEIIQSEIMNAGIK